MSKLIRVLHTEWSDGWGGQEIRIINEINTMRSSSVEVFLACKESSVIRKKALESNIKVFILPFRGNADLKTLLALKKIIKLNSIDIVNTHSGKDTWVGGLAAKFSGIKFIRTRHLSQKINPLKLNFINELADYIFTTGEEVRLDMIKNNRIKENKILSIPTGIDESLYNPANYKIEECRRKFNLNGNEIVIGILAVLRQFKRHDLFLKMAKQLKAKYPDKKFVFMIAGDGPQKENIQKIIHKLNLHSSVRLLGHISNTPEFLCALDILVLSSDSKEGVPQSVMQGLFMNKQVVATNAGSTIDLIHNNNFQLVEKGNFNSLVNGVSVFIDKKNEIITRKHMIKNFSSFVMTQKILKIYKILIN